MPCLSCVASKHQWLVLRPPDQDSGSASEINPSQHTHHTKRGNYNWKEDIIMVYRIHGRLQTAIQESHLIRVK